MTRIKYLRKLKIKNNGLQRTTPDLCFKDTYKST